jgi:deoxyribonuclease-4
MRLGMHISTAGNLIGTPARAAELGAESIQIFAGNPRGWRPTIYSEKQGSDFKTATREAGLADNVFIHMMYLVAYGSANDELRSKSIEAMKHMMATADLLGVTGVVTHMGSHKDQTLEEAVKRLGDGLKECLAVDSSSYLVLENCAGSGAIIGDSFEELKMIYEGLDRHSRVKFCLDTAHLLASGYDIRTSEGFDKTLDQFDKLLGLYNRVCYHINDTKIHIHGRVDRHENIGDGYLGIEAFRAIVNHPKLKDIPGMLEVPGLDDKGPDKPNLDRLKALRA